MFREIQKNDSFPELEARILKTWKNDDSFKKSIELRKDAPDFTFYDGPPFATGLPHYGHLLAGTLKDIVPRYWTMQGKRVPRRFGWDCHGLPVESLIQNELKLSGVAEIRAFGEDKFNESCRSSVLKYTSEWRETVGRMGRWVDFDNDYKTMDPSFMESVWWVFKQCWDKGLIYQGYRIQPYSPSLATPLSNFETNQGYKDRQDPSLTLIMPLVGEAASILVWTTTPWTLPSNMVLAVGAAIDYLLVEFEGQRYYIAEARLSSFFKEATVLKKCKGSDLAGKSYTPLFRYMPEDHEGLYKVVCADFVSTQDGTGIVHIAPSFGEEDFNLGKEIGLPLFDPLDVEGRFTEVVPPWQGIGAKEADKSIIALLKEQKRVFKHETLVHSYPHCYRTGVPLLYRALKTWFLALDVPLTSAEGVTKTLKDWMVDNNQQINWVPDHIKDGRFGKWLGNARDWNISRNRFWGTPMPIWIAEDGDQIAVGSRAELEKLSGQKLEDLHKHFTDTLEVRTKDGVHYDPTGKLYTRTPEVFDCWFESGSMPYAQNHYPFENKAQVEAGFPADFIAEGLDQTRGWFYTLMVLSSALFQKPAFKNVIVNGIILAEDGQKMSKSLRNYPDPNDLISRMGADAIRLFMINSAALKADDLKFSEEGVKGIIKQVMLPLWNCTSFFISNHNADAAKGQLSWKAGQVLESDNELDRWIFANLQDLLEKVETEMNAYRLYNVVPAIVDFVESLTNWYLRRSRRRFWKGENDGDKNFAYATLYQVLVTFSKILAPFLPFLSEEIYQMLVREQVAGAPESVHHCDFPKVETKYCDASLVHKMSLVRSVVDMGRVLRATNEIKNRQPLSVLTIVIRNEDDRELLHKMSALISEELNVKEIHFSANESELVQLSAKANFKTLGSRMGKEMKKVADLIAGFGADEVKTLMQGGRISLEQGEISLEDILVQRSVRAGLVVEANDHFTVALNTVISPELDRECLIRELVNRVQNQRKEMDLQITDRICIRIATQSELVKQALGEYNEYLLGETQADQVEIVAGGADLIETQLNDEKVYFEVKAV
jgi:isoleucyl-tRNA synthetase